MRKKAPLELMHTDVFSLDTTSHCGSQYFVTFIDDYHRKLWVSTLKTKDQVLSLFKEFQESAKRETGWTLKVVRADNGGNTKGSSRSVVGRSKSVPNTPLS